MIPQGILDEYEIIKVMQESAATAVLLVREKASSETRVLKAIHSSRPDANSIFSEANLLAGLNFPALPTIYKTEQIDNWNYLVEEYISGQSLKDYLIQENTISEKRLLEISIGICKIIERIHDSNEDTILYLDMKPEHVILDQKTIRLIDFGIATTKSNSINSFCKGTLPYAPLEQQSGQTLDTYTDVYQVAMVIKEMMKYCPKAMGQIRLESIVDKATKVNFEKRTKTIKDLEDMLYDYSLYRGYIKSSKEHLGKKIAVIGADRGVGCTKIAMGLCSYLNEKGNSCYYKSYPDGSVTKLVSRNLKGYVLKDGVLYHKHFAGLMDYGQTCEQFIPPKGHLIVDYGYSDDYEAADLVVYVVNASILKRRVTYPEWIRDKSVVVVANLSTRINAAHLSGAIKKKVHVFPYNPYDFLITKEVKKTYKMLLRGKGFDRI